MGGNTMMNNDFLSKFYEDEARDKYKLDYQNKKFIVDTVIKKDLFISENRILESILDKTTRNTAPRNSKNYSDYKIEAITTRLYNNLYEETFINLCNSEEEGNRIREDFKTLENAFNEDKNTYMPIEVSKIKKLQLPIDTWHIFMGVSREDDNYIKTEVNLVYVKSVSPRSIYGEGISLDRVYRILENESSNLQTISTTINKIDLITQSGFYYIYALNPKFQVKDLKELIELLRKEEIVSKNSNLSEEYTAYEKDFDTFKNCVNLFTKESKNLESLANGHLKIDDKVIKDLEESLNNKVKDFKMPMSKGHKKVIFDELNKIKCAI